ncbi:MAG: NAD(P)-dependent oxidoreductase [Actinomycetota bacterium]|nr:NAD(P)-dependent oxidoreductase [Actinomycetota bacterium]
MKVLLTGASGFVGQHLLGDLLGRGADVRAVVRDSSHRPIKLSHQRLEIVETSNLFEESSEGLKRLVSDCDVLVHAAWAVDPPEYLSSIANVECLTGSLRLAEAFVACGGRRFVGIGTCFEYDLSSGPVTVDCNLRPATLYGACKASLYLTLDKLFEVTSREFLWCRLFYLTGPGEHPQRLIPYLHRQLSTGEPAHLGPGHAIRDYVDVRVAAAQIADLTMGAAVGPRNVSSGRPTTIRALAEAVADVYGRRDLLFFASGDNGDSLPDVVASAD